MTKHFDQVVSAEAIDLAAHKIADSGLGHTEPLCCSSLCKVPGLYEFREFYHEVCPCPQILGLFRRESEISEYIAG